MVKTVWISDMSGFTRLTHDIGTPAVMDLIRTMRKVVCPLLESSGGTVFKIDADNIYALFDTPVSALQASLKAHRALTDPLAICIGIGHGEVISFKGEKDYYGLEVNVASKLGEDTAGPKETLVSEAAYALLPSRIKSLSEPIRTISVGGVDYPYHLFLLKALEKVGEPG